MYCSVSYTVGESRMVPGACPNTASCGVMWFAGAQAGKLRIE